MALSKLKVQQVDREKLYFNKYSLRGVFNTPSLYYTRNVDNILSYRKTIQDTKAYTYNWRGRIQENLINYDLIEKILLFKNTHKSSGTTKIRYEYDNMGVYTNDPSVLEEMEKIQPGTKFTQIILSPAGTIYFKTTPPAKYRIYMKGKQIDESFRDSLLEFFGRGLVKPCRALCDALKGKNSWRWSWIKNNYFIDYDDETTLSYIGLMFPDLLGKSYKLEKKEG